jgi:hypothetical protein
MYVSRLLSLFLLFQVVGCGDVTNLEFRYNLGNPGVMSGVAATGAPISGAKVEIKGSNGLIVEDTTKSDGSYSANITTLDEPYLVRVSIPGSDEKLISVASKSALAEGKKINVTPLSHIIVSNVFETTDADQLFSNFSGTNGEAKKISKENLVIKLKEKKDALLQVFKDAGLIGPNGVIKDNNLDFLNGPLLAGSSIGIDGLLDVIKFTKPSGSSTFQIKLPGTSTPIVVSTNPSVPPTFPILSSTEIQSGLSQLSAIDKIRLKMNSVAKFMRDHNKCNGDPLEEPGNDCDLDTIYNGLAPFFHLNFQEDGRNKEASVWSWMCVISHNDEAKSRSECLDPMKGKIDFENVSLKDITLLALNGATGSREAHVRFNTYIDKIVNGKIESLLRHSEDIYLKEDGVDNFKLLGNKKSFKYWIGSESLHLTKPDGNNSPLPGYVHEFETYLRFHVDEDVNKDLQFGEGHPFKLVSEGGKNIFKNGANELNFYLVTTPGYDEEIQECVPRMRLLTTDKPYEVDDGMGNITLANFETACPALDPCNCPNVSFNYDDYEVSHLVKEEIDLMNVDQKVSMSYTLVGGILKVDEFFIKKPLIVTLQNTDSLMPQFGMSVDIFCSEWPTKRPINLTSGAGFLEHVYLFYQSDTANLGGGWIDQNFGDELIKSWEFSPYQNTDDLNIQNHGIFLKSRNNGLQFTRNVKCAY